jgi:small subunit ribosomal protein S6
MSKYELAVVLTTQVDDETRAATIENIKGLIERFGGTVAGVEEWGSKRLAYEIQKMKEGYYYFITFEADSSCPNELEGRMRIMDNVLRYLCVRQDA